VADYYRLDKPRGVLVDTVNDDTPAADAGLAEGDIILAVDGKRVDTMQQLRNTVSLLPVGHDAKLEILREGRTIEKKVTLGRLPGQDELAGMRGEAPSADDGIDGVTVRELDRQMRAHAGLPDDVDGVLVLEVSQRSNAARKGLARGDVIVEVNGKNVTDLDEYRRAVERDEDRPIKLRVYRPRTEGAITLFVPR
jgi:serine protease Do